MSVSKITLDNQTLIDLTNDTVTADKLLQGYTAHNASGEIITGTYSGGGSTPTGTLQITSNGTYDVSTYASANVSVGAYKIATGTITPNSGHMYITHNLNSTKLIVFVQGRVNTAVTAQYRTLGGMWLSDDFVSQFITERTYDVSGYSTAITSLTVPINWYSTRSIAASTATATGAYSSPNGNIDSNSDYYAIGKIVCTDANNIQVYARYNTQNGMVFDYTVLAFD